MQKLINQVVKMGVWGVDAFSNDDAADWLYGLYDSDDLSVVDETLSRVIGTKSYLEAPEGCEGIAAAEIVARVQGRPDPNSPGNGELDGWIARLKAKPEAVLAKKAHLAIDRILTEPSELLELWGDSTEYKEWLASLSSVKARVHV
jgi:hypothetical protein